MLSAFYVILTRNLNMRFKSVYAFSKETESVRSICCCSVAKSWLTLYHPWTAAHQVSLSFTISQSWLKHMSIESMMPSNHFILCHPLLFLLSIFPSTGAFPSQLFTSSDQSIRASGSASVLPVNIQDWFPLGLISLLSVQGTLKSLLQHHSSKASILQHSAFFMVQLSYPYVTTGKT